MKFPLTSSLLCVDKHIWLSVQNLNLEKKFWPSSHHPKTTAGHKIVTTERWHHTRFLSYNRTSVSELICPKWISMRSAVINVHCSRGILPAHMMSTTTMMMSSPALSWAAWPNSSIITSSGERTHTQNQQRATEDMIHCPREKMWNCQHSEPLQGKIKE